MYETTVELDLMTLRTLNLKLTFKIFMLRVEVGMMNFMHHSLFEYRPTTDCFGNLLDVYFPNKICKASTLRPK